MFTGVNFEKAIDYWKKGREVIVIDRNSRTASGGYDNFPFEELFRNVELLADVPAVEDPDFKKAVTEMVEEKPEGENQAPPSARPEVSRLPAGKTTKEIILDLAAQGITAPEIARQTGIKYNTVYFHLNPDKCAKKPARKTEEITVDYKNPDARPGWNADRKNCKTCRYRQAHNNPTDKDKGNCNYIEIAGHSRGCTVEDCNRYVKGARMERKRK